MAGDLEGLSSALASVVEGSAPSVVRVHGRRRAAASGIVWSGEGIIATANHSLEWDEGIEVVLSDAKAVAAEVIGRDPTTDLALLRVSVNGLPAAQWADPDGLKTGHLVVAVSRPGRAVRASLGTVSVLAGAWRTSAGGLLDCHLETGLARHPGFSGSLLLDSAGRAIGLNSSGLLRGVTLAVAAPTLRRVFTRLLEHGEIRRGFLGIGTYPVRLPAGLAQQLGQAAGLLIVSVEPESPAAQAGLLQGDVLVALDDRGLGHAGDLLPLLDEDRIGAEAAARLVRGGELREVRLTIGSRGRTRRSA